MSPWMLLQLGWKALPVVILAVGLSLLMMRIENVRVNRRWKRDVELGAYSGKLVQSKLQSLELENARLRLEVVEKTGQLKLKSDLVAAIKSLMGIHDGYASQNIGGEAGAGRGSDTGGRSGSMDADRPRAGRRD